MLQLRLAFLSTSIGLLLAGCESEPDSDPPLVPDPLASESPTSDSLIGKWEDSRGKTWEYFSDGTVLMSEKGKDSHFIGNWSRVDDGRVKIEFLMLGNTVGDVFTEKKDGDKISLTDSNGKEVHWKRVP